MLVKLEGGSSINPAHITKIIWTDSRTHFAVTPDGSLIRLSAVDMDNINEALKNKSNEERGLVLALEQKDAEIEKLTKAIQATQQVVMDGMFTILLGKYLDIGLTDAEIVQLSTERFVGYMSRIPAVTDVTEEDV